MRSVTVATGAVLAAIFLTTAASAQAQTAPSGMRLAQASQPVEPAAPRRKPSIRLRVYPRLRRRARWGLSAVFPRPQCGAGLHRDLCPGKPAERHGDRAAHELFLASRLELPQRRRMAPISPVPTTSADVPQTMMAIASCVKLLAEPSPPPGPWDAKAASAHTSPVATKAAAMAQVCISSVSKRCHDDLL